MQSRDHTRLGIMVMLFLILGVMLTLASLRILSAREGLADVELAEANNRFALDLYAQLAGRPGNLVVSPLSVNVGLAMVHAGARGQTATQIAEVMHLPQTFEPGANPLGPLVRNLSGRRSGQQLVLANAMFAQEGFDIKSPFQKHLRDHFDAELQVFDLTGWPGDFDPAKAEAARERVNGWVARQTRNMITEVVPSSLPTQDTRLFLVNAIAFEGEWATPFDVADTRDMPFRLSSGQAVPVPTMHLTADFRYTETEALQMLELPYKGKRIAMAVLLPKEDRSLEEIEQGLTLDQLEEWHRAATVQEVMLWLPRFSYSSQFDLGEPLSNLGMKDAFSWMSAGFSGITGEPFGIEAALHAARIKVNETGTRAAAASAFAMAELAVPDSVFFRADRPFLFLIRDIRSGAILFLGRLADPSEVEPGNWHGQIN